MLEDIANIIETANIAELEKDLFMSRSPAEPDKCISIYEYAGLPPQDGVDFVSLSLQVKCRAKDYKESRDLAWRVFKALDAARRLNTTTAIFHKIKPIQPPFPLEIDKNGRIYFVQNFRVHMFNKNL